jgi:RimJ/RimL family protein N-acetyltransferase
MNQLDGTPYKCLEKQRFDLNEFSLVPLRSEDQLLIMKWRNEQIYHLRQAKPLTEADQKTYFDNVVAKLFGQEKPNQILFSFLKNDECIGYGGLVHINWIDRNAEISFIMDTALEKAFFEYHWSCYLSLIEKVAFEELRFHKIFTYAFDLRPHLYPILLKNGFTEDARLKEHCYFEGKFIDVLIHTKYENNFSKSH